jgi:hypothetical protein
MRHDQEAGTPMTALAVLPTAQDVQERPWTEADRQAYRVRRAHMARLDRPPRATAVWAAKELVYWCTCTDPRNAYHVVLRLPLGQDAAASSPAAGDRAVRLLYRWFDLEPHLHLPPSQLSNTVLAALASQGNMLRAGLAYAASGRNHVP